MYNKILLFIIYIFNKMKKKTLSGNTTEISCIILLI
jgi:hypothetical protein